MENVPIKGRGGNDLQHKNWKGKILRIWITIIRHGGLGHEVQESWPYLSNATPWPYELSQARELHLIDKATTLEPCSAQGTNALLPFCLDRWRCQILPIPSSSPPVKKISFFAVSTFQYSLTFWPWSSGEKNDNSSARLAKEDCTTENEFKRRTHSATDNIVLVLSQKLKMSRTVTVT